MESYIGKLLDNRYQLLELIGTGGMSNVYKGKDLRLNRLVAVKTLKSDLAENAEFRRRFRDESLAVAQLSHANIVSVYDVSSFEGIEYIVMELIDGITLKQYMERRGQMDWREALHFILQIAHGLSHAHSRGIIHRDIKPQNIMVLRDGSVKVADFGIACLADASNTLAQEALGSVHYISPEQARGDRVDERSDIYSAGVVLYEMLTGRLPFEGDNPVSVAIQHLSSMPLNPREINASIPEPMELICLKAMNPDLDKRYPTADAMAEDLEKIRKDPQVDLDYIRSEMKPVVDDEPTMPVPVAQIKQAEQKHADGGRKQRPQGMTAQQKAVLTVAGIAAAVALIVLLFTVILGSFGDGDEHHSGSYEVPNILGYTVEEAQSLERIRDVFTITVTGTREDANYLPGQIISQDPGAGTMRKSNLEIKVVLCAEVQPTLLPNLEGLSYQNAKIQLQNLGMNLNILTEEHSSNDYPAGDVIASFPAAGTELHEGDTVTLAVSKGPDTIMVIPFAGMTLQQATQTAQQMGLVVGRPVYQYSGYASGQVIDQSIPADTEVSGGTEIVFTVSGDYSTHTVLYQVPETLAGKASVRAEFYLDGELVETTFLESPNPEDPIGYDYTGLAGTTLKAYASFDGIRTEEVEITF